jgi:DNA-binding transcriptional MerR regulator
MSKKSDSEGTKIAQAAKELNVTSVTIRRYLSEFNIETTTDENGVKVLPPNAMEELQLIRQLKEDGLTNPKVLEELEERRSKPAPKSKSKAGSKAAPKSTSKASSKAKEVVQEEEEEEAPPPPKRVSKQAAASKAAAKPVVEEEPAEVPEEEEAPQAVADLGGAGRSKHSLTCQTCGKVFEHMNPRLRDCLDCYRTKRKERRRGGSDKHKNVIQHPVVQQVIAKTSQQQSQLRSGDTPQREPREPRELREPREHREQHYQAPVAQSMPTVPRQSTVRNYRKAIEETRGITASLKRRLERPDLPEGERRWLEQIYAYQLILHQGWRHLAEYKAGTKEQSKGE